MKSPEDGPTDGRTEGARDGRRDRQPRLSLSFPPPAAAVDPEERTRLIIRLAVVGRETHARRSLRRSLARPDNPTAAETADVVN